MKFSQTQAELMRMIEQKRFGVDGRLPPERELCAQLGISRTTLRKALDHLEARGLVWRHVGRGTFVGRPADRTTGRLLDISERTSPAELMELRLMLEPEIARLAAIRASPTEIAFMRHCIVKNEASEDTETYELWDGTLHRAIAEAARNKLILAVYDAANELRKLTSWGRLRAFLVTPREKVLYWCAQHRGFVEAIAARDPHLAAHLARAHVEEVFKQMQVAGVEDIPPYDEVQKNAKPKEVRN